MCWIKKNFQKKIMRQVISSITMSFYLGIINTFPPLLYYLNPRFGSSLNQDGCCIFKIVFEVLIINDFANLI